MSDRYNRNLMVWAVTDGPILKEDMEPEDQPEHPEYQCFLVLKVAHKDNLEDIEDFELWFDSLDDAYAYKQAVNTAMYPVPMLGVT